MVNILIGCTGSVATIKLPILINTIFANLETKKKIVIKVITTEHAQHFFKTSDIPDDVKLYRDEDEWTSWSQRGDPIIHIDLVKWADIFIIAPLDANTLAKIANGLCDNLLTSTVRAWEMHKTLIFCPAMNTKMYDHPLTAQQIKILCGWGYHIIPCIEKTLVCGDKGNGAMAEVSTILKYLNSLLKNK